jgi:dienelactone hydrolase
MNHRAVTGLLLACLAPAALAADALALDLHEEVQHLAVTVKDMYGRQETRSIPLTLFRPAGAGPFPLVVMNHGRSSQGRATMGRSRFEPLSRYLVSKGFAVIVPTRVSYGETYGDFDPESSGSCASMRPQAASDAAVEQVLAAVQYAKTQPWADTTRWLVMGVSVGGFTVLGVASRNPPGLVGAVNFSGGRGGDPVNTPGRPCSPSVLERFWGQQAGSAQVPTLWIYWLNDLFWGPDWPRRWARAWADGGGKVEFHQLPETGKDGHAGTTSDMDHWVPLVERYLAQLGFDHPGTVARPPRSDYAAIDNVDKVPATATARSEGYVRFLATSAPRAFAISPSGRYGFASGDWALGRAIGNCQAVRGETCRLYAVDDEVVWLPEAKEQKHVQEDPDRQPR